MSIRSELESALADIFAGDDPETVTRWPQGIEGAAVSVKGFWEPDETPTRQGDTDADQTTLGGVLRVLHSTTVHSEDLWVIDGETFATLAVSDKHAGHKTLTLQRVDRFSTSRHRTKL